ncbi:uncharacterized protein TRIADDRAFT_58261 [Trichoplax adhaerens]|uniref:Sister chromatid cohesion protein DCC1 n=1 Tax=Trichoplax adhaerens TaxID=10228 RepID=B3S1B1_TRIAD|nr:hypothetical protein TRIADDRAFT_58261 [Trichoplax adhaerens]EDV23211.1 hypothetical protein TRIADDRAFT_58261 [Trichoplax adhaerens]|eukprot:XP_002114121.1 hypothetical protein TRIADDRAFT_58261 [Trichoplax adhaerens]
MAGNLKRDYTQISQSAEQAGLSSHLNLVQELVLSPDNNRQFQLLEATPEILEAIESSRKIVFRGEEEDDVTLCVDNATFDVRIAETSNTLLLSPNCIWPQRDHGSSFQECKVQECQTWAIPKSYLELRKCGPRIHKLKRLLQENPFKGVDDTKENKYTLKDLLNKVQASEGELLAAIEAMNACNIDGYWRILDESYKEQVFQCIINLVEEKDWNFHNFSLGECCDILEELYPRYIINHCIKCYGTIDEDKCFLDEDKVCRQCAISILKPAGKGYALTDTTSKPPVIWLFQVSELPPDPYVRFNKLFKVRTKWSLEEIEPYIKDLATGSQSLNTILLKYTRTSTDLTLFSKCTLIIGFYGCNAERNTDYFTERR